MASSLFNSKKAKRILCGRFSRISTKLPRIPLRRQKLPKVVGEPENYFSYTTTVLPEASVFSVIFVFDSCSLLKCIFLLDSVKASECNDILCKQYT